MKYPPSFDWSVLAAIRKDYVRKPLNPSALAGSSFYTVGTHAHKTFKEWSDWLRHQSLTRR